MKRWVLFLFLLLSLSGCDRDPVWASIQTPRDLWKGLIAEDVSGGYSGMYAVACCVRNRLNSGMSVGLVGLKRKDLDEFVNRQPKKYHDMAKSIVKEVFENNSKDVVNGATHYESIKYPKPLWSYKMKIVAKVGEHIFYR